MYKFSFFSWVSAEASPGFSLLRPQPLAAASVAAQIRENAIRALRISFSFRYPARTQGRQIS